MPQFPRRRPARIADSRARRSETVETTNSRRAPRPGGVAEVGASALAFLAGAFGSAQARVQDQIQAPASGLGALPGPAAAASPGPLPSHDLSPWGMFLHADTIVKAVMLGLGFASVVTWTLWVVKGSALAREGWLAGAAVRALGAAEGLGGAGDPAWRRSRAVGAMVEAARGEVDRSAGLPPEGVKERVSLALGRIEARAARSMTRGTGAIATIGSTAPFVGLFGTVWGIMDSFVGIGQAHTSNLAVVAPGIAEALLATAIGLVAAIPAVVIYNGFARATAGYRALLADASAEVLRHLSRDLDRGAATARPARRAAE